MSTFARTETKLLDLNVTQAAVYWTVGPASVFTIESRLLSGTWGTAVVTINRSNDGYKWFAMESALTLTIGGGMTVATDATGFTRLRAQVTTVEGAAGVVELVLLAKGDA